MRKNEIKRFPMPDPMRHDFTLIELLIVITIIAILAAMLLPALGKSKALANTATCSSQMKQMGLILQHYLEDNKDFFPIYHGWLPGPPLYDNGMACFTGTAKKYKRENGVYHTGDAYTISHQTNTSPFIGLAMMYLDGDFTLFYCPGDIRPDVKPYDYISANKSYAYEYQHIGYFTGRRLRDLRYPQRQIVFSENPSGIGALRSDILSGNLYTWYYDDGSKPLHDPHGARYNFTIADGHVETWGFQETFGKKSWFRTELRR